MNKDFSDKLRCQVCGKGSFKKHLYKGNDSFQCNNCGETLKIINGIYHFYKKRENVSGIDYTLSDWPQKEKEREKEYEQKYGFNDAWLLSLPYPKIETETTFQKKEGALGDNFFEVLKRLNFKGNEYVFDMAAGCCWTSNEFAKRGCHVVCTDIRTIKYYGLRSAEVYFDQDRTKFDRLCWAFGGIPFQDETFDVIFCQNAFQYVGDLQSIVKEIYRTLKPGGRFILTWTGVHAPFKSRKWGPGHYLLEYIYHIRRCGFDVDIFPPLPLYNKLGEVAARFHFGHIPAKLFSKMWNTSPIFRKILVKSFVPISFFFGAPFNMIASKSA